jgi:DNA mismatch endonuclease (patch repair protein)
VLRCALGYPLANPGLKLDTLSPAERSERMSLVRGKDTKPELVVRKLLWRMGFRYRLHGAGLPGRPDIVFAVHRKVVLVHGCFWHQHPGCGRQPKSRQDFWLPKLGANRERDLKNQRRLRAMGWTYLVTWECQLRNQAVLESRLRRFLERGRA